VTCLDERKKLRICELCNFANNPGQPNQPVKEGEPNLTTEKYLG